ncbi:MAG: tetratricopeptide repeat protein, partial [Cyanobacteria bacterium P01_C01_bin.89]
AEKFPGGVVWLSGAQFLLDLVGVAQGAFLTTADMERLGKLETEGQKARFCWERWPAGDVLVVVDDVVEFKAGIKPLLPPDKRFRVLLTTRNRKLLAKSNCVFLDVLDLEKALALLTVWIGEERLGRERDLAVELVERLGRLPLAIDLVGAYLQEDEDLSLARLVVGLEEKGLKATALTALTEDVQAERGVAAAFELSWERLSAGAQRLAVLLGCFGLAPVPWDLVRQCLPEEDGEQLDHWRTRELQRLSLLERQGDGLYGLHPLIWQFFGEKRVHHNDGETLQQSFLNTLVAVAKTVPQTPTLDDQSLASIAVSHLERTVEFAHKISTENENYVWACIALARLAESQSLWPQAEKHLCTALKITETRQGANHLDTATSLNNLAELYRSQGRYSEAEPLYRRALEIYEEQLGATHWSTANSLNNLALLYKSQGRYDQAEPLYRRALETYEEQLGATHWCTASSLNNLAELHQSQGRYDQAEPLYRRSLEIHEEQLGATHPDTALSLNNLALLYKTQGRYSEAEPLYRRSLEIHEEQLGPIHPSTATSLSNLALLYESQGRYSEAEPLYRRSLEIKEAQLGADHPSMATSVNNLAGLYESQGRYSEAEPLYVRAIEIYEEQLGGTHPLTATSLNNLAVLYYSQNRLGDSEKHMARALSIRIQALGQGHPDTQSSSRDLITIITAAINQGRTADLSNHPLTQAILQQLQNQNSQP